MTGYLFRLTKITETERSGSSGTVSEVDTLKKCIMAGFAVEDDSPADKHAI